LRGELGGGEGGDEVTAGPQLPDVLGQGGPRAADREAVTGGERREVVVGRGRRRGRCVEDLAHIRCFRSGEVLRGAVFCARPGAGRSVARLFLTFLFTFSYVGTGPYRRNVSVGPVDVGTQPFRRNAPMLVV